MLIAHLYADLLNLYGNDGNIKILLHHLREIGEEVEIVTPTVGDAMDFNQYDLVYMGSGIEENIAIAIADLKRYQKEIKEAIANNKMFFVTGNAIDIFGAKIVGSLEIDGLGIFDYTAREVERIKKDVVYQWDFLDNPILGYENHSHILENNQEPLYGEEGIRHNQFYGTYMEGPILVRNPELLKYVIKQLVKEEMRVDKLDLQLETVAYENFKALLNPDGMGDSH